MLKKRQKELLELLEFQNDFLTVNVIANQLGVSRRTIHSDLNLLEDYIPSLGKYLDKKRGVGVILRDLREKDVLKIEDNHIALYDTVTRRIEIMELLLFKKRSISFNHLSDMFMVSKTSIIKDLEFIMNIFKSGSDIKLKSDSQGTRVYGTEIDWQKALLQFNRYTLSNSNIYQKDTILKKMNLLEPYYGEKIVTVCTSILYSYVRENVNAISDYYIQNILNIYVILVYRNLSGNHIQEKQVENSVEDIYFFEESAEKLLSKAKLRLNFTYTNEDISYFSHHLISNRFEPFPEDSIDNRLVDELLNRVSESLNINFSEDEKLEEQLKKHIPPMIYRLQSNNKTDNPFTNQVKIEFSLTFNIIWVVLSEYEKELGILFNEDEIAFLTIYFQSAIERAKMNRKFLIICQMGIATSELLRNRIKSIIPSLDSIEISSVAEMEQIDFNDFDLIISTIKVEIPEKKVLLVSPFLTDSDIKNIKRLGYEKNNEKQLNSIITVDYLAKYVNQKFIYVNTSFSTKEEMFKKIGQKLIKHHYATQNFVDSLYDRENLGGTDLPSGIAVPHGNPTNVNETIIVIIKNKNKFRWDKYYVDVIFLIGISKKDRMDTKNILSDIYKIVDDSDMLLKIKNSSSKEELIKTLGVK